ncbi:hypothetical protein SAPIO_CDS2313 [Scedosporium apiospermum]|uniref:Uncharacterized protein n=1 Tax=Pseudallescheria apiosperma TaxID=563466 RepID=A0A084GC81_PSEDA|nr:uncharacterized protein SAPIO_CDS2313 [Scedosporium apiospermum]KEZ44943.1 hypothetical protein SAPIO_CDS2313 [Scedosporium apiospermum]
MFGRLADKTVDSLLLVLLDRRRRRRAEVPHSSEAFRAKNPTCHSESPAHEAIGRENLTCEATAAGPWEGL